MAARLSKDRAEQEARICGVSPLTDYPGSVGKSWRVVCSRCGDVLFRSLDTLRKNTLKYGRGCSCPRKKRRWGPAAGKVRGLDRIRLEEVQSRFWEKVIASEFGCLVWDGTVRPDGYGVFGLGSRTDGLIRAHRFSYIHLVGDVPEGLTLDHLCRNTLCVNPDHLEAVTMALNLKRVGSGNELMCKNGLHERTPENIYKCPRGYEVCRACGRESTRRYRAKNREKERKVMQNA